MRLRSAFAALRRSALASRRSSGPRDLRRELDEQSSEDYWRRREQSRRRRFQLVARWHGLGLRWASVRQQIGFLLGAFRSVLGGFTFGGLLIGAVLVVEVGLARYASPSLIPAGETTPPLSAFPTLAVQVSASLLGFYLASVGIVLGTSYRDVPAGLRALVLGNPQTRFHLNTIGLAIGAGLTLVLLQSLGLPYGYVTLVAYSAVVVFGGWAFVELAFGAFNLFNPLALGGQPLEALSRAVDRIDAKGLAGDEAVLRASSRDADRALGVLAELIDLMTGRASVARADLALLVELLLAQLRFYAHRKHLISPTNAWFIREPIYPRWIEASDHEASIALQTSTPLQPRIEPTTEWLERRSAELAAAALESCVAADDQDSALRITRAVASTAETFARCSLFEEATVLTEVVRDRCWAIQSRNAAALALSAEPPVMLTSLLVGCRAALTSWHEEVSRAVAAIDWDLADTTLAPIRAPARVRASAQVLLREVRAEHDVEGRRVTPDWYLRFALAGEYFSALRDFAEKLPSLLEEYVAGPPAPQSSPAVEAMVGTQSLQVLAKAELVVAAASQATEDLGALRRGRDPLPTRDLAGFAERVQEIRPRILQRIATALPELQPERSHASPDLFGEVWFTLVHHVEHAIANGDVDLVQHTFSQIVAGTFILYDHVVSTYKPPTYTVTPAHLDPMIDALELSGLAVIYEVLRGDASAAPVREAWTTRLEASGKAEKSARQLLDLLDLVRNAFPFQMSPRSAARSEWGLRLAKRIIEGGYARPMYFPLRDPPPWNAPPLIKMLGVDESMLSSSIEPRAIFAAEVLGPLSGESDETLRARAGLKRYFEARDHRGVPEDTDGLQDDAGTPRQDEVE